MKADETKRLEWEAHIKGWEESGLSQRAYCAREGIKWPSFDYWRRHLKELNQSKKVELAKPLQLVPVKVEIPSVVAKELRLTHASGWELRMPLTMEITCRHPLICSNGLRTGHRTDFEKDTALTTSHLTQATLATRATYTDELLSQ